jgi:hypothetical protein
MANPIDQEAVRRCFEYLPETGELAWKYNPDKGFWWNSRNVGKIAGSLNGGNGYIQIGFDGKKYLAHRIVWVYFNGPIPDGIVVDHIDRNRSNNRLANLRLLTVEKNIKNCDRWDRWISTGVWRGPPAPRPWVKGADENRIPSLVAEFEAARVLRGHEPRPVSAADRAPKLIKPVVAKTTSKPRKPVVLGERVQYVRRGGVLVAHIVIEGRLYPLRDGQDPVAFKKAILAASKSLSNATQTADEEGEAA